MTALFSRLSFALAAAVVAASLGDPFVESVSNSGIFGGHYADDNHLGVVPALFAGIGLTAALLLVRCVRLWCGSARGSGDRILAAAKTIAGRSPLRDLPSVFALQMLAVYAIERSEAWLAGGTVDGLEWLGGPIAFSLLAHALIGAACTLLLAAFVRALLRTFASLAYGAAHLVWLAPSRAVARSFRLRADTKLCRRAQAPHVRQTGGRAPPLLLDSRLIFTS